MLAKAREKKRKERCKRLIEGAARGDIDEVNHILATNDVDVDVDDEDYDQRTALHLAASNGHIDMVRHLILVQGAHVNVLDRYGGTPMMDAVRHKHHDVVAFLRRHGATLELDKAASKDA